MAELRLSEIYIYPIKGLGGIQLTHSRVMDKGLEFDRRMMLVDKDNRFMTQRTSARLALLKTSMVDDVIVIASSAQKLVIDKPADGPEIETQVWDDKVTVLEISSTYSKWFSEQLGLECKLVSFPEKNLRPVYENHQINNEQVSLADGYPFLILGQSSLDHLNTKLDRALPINRFRPNLVFTGGRPHEEDTWHHFTIGKNRFVGVKPCARCVVTTINQDTMEKGVEPLKTLSTYRKFGHDVYFGQNVIATDHGEVRVGDEITVSSFSAGEVATFLTAGK